jgi:hypothetical protein
LSTTLEAESLSAKDKGLFRQTTRHTTSQSQVNAEVGANLPMTNPRPEVCRSDQGSHDVSNACKTLALCQCGLTRGVPAFCTHYSGPERTQMSNRQGADARRDATSGQIVRIQGPGAAALDQESPGSSPGGATRRQIVRYAISGFALSRLRLCCVARGKAMEKGPKPEVARLCQTRLSSRCPGPVKVRGLLL